MGKSLKILFVTSELAPLVSTGGLAEVAGALPRALRARGHDVRVAIPRYRQIPDAAAGEQYCLCVADFGDRKAHGALRQAVVPGTDIPLYLVEHEGYFGRETPYGTGAYEFMDNAERFCFFCLALLHGIPQTGWKPDVVHCHDWHTAPLPAFLKTRWRSDAYWGGMPSLFTIHNLAFQGRYGAEHYAATGLPAELFHPGCMEFEGDMNLMKGAIHFADKISTVSPRYAKEIQTLNYGAGLHGVLGGRADDLYGILNWVDTNDWNPAQDPHLAAVYSAGDLAGKKACKAALQKTLGLEPGKPPVFGLVTRLYWQKGVDLLLDAMDRIMEHKLQIAVLGAGDPDLEARLTAAAAKYPGRVGLYLGYNNALAHQVIAGSDFLVMPSRYEPCGLAQMYALAYGTVPIVRRTGGLADSVVNATAATLKDGTANGLSFMPVTPGALARAVDRAMELWRKPATLEKLRRAGMARDLSWDRSCRAYAALYEKTMAEVR